MISSPDYNTHSADVSMELLVNGNILPIAQMGPDFLLLGRSINHPPDTARIVIRIDSSERDWEVRLPEGITADVSRVEIALVNGERV